MERSFKGIWIPKEIWLSKELTLQEKVFLVEIESLDNENGCFASNSYFSDFFGLSRNRCSEIIKTLEKKGLISIDYIRTDGKKSIEKRVIKVVGKSNRGIRKVEGGYSENREDNNTSISNTKEYIYSIFEFWNEQKIVTHRKLNDQMKRHINARIKEDGYSEEELKKAISNYKQILDSDNYYWTHKWTLQEFMKPGNVIRFMDEADPFTNYLDKTTYVKGQQYQNNHNQVDDGYDYGF